MGGRKRSPDNLDLDSRRAMEEGYGVHYGWWKAGHPITRKQTRKREPEMRMEVCPECGRQYPYRANKRYCSADCRNRRNGRLAYEKKKK